MTRVFCIGGSYAGRHIIVPYKHDGEMFQMPDLNMTNAIRAKLGPNEAVIGDVHIDNYTVRTLLGMGGTMYFAVADDNTMLWAIQQLIIAYKRSQGR